MVESLVEINPGSGVKAAEWRGGEGKGGGEGGPAWGAKDSDVCVVMIVVCMDINGLPYASQVSCNL